MNRRAFISGACAMAAVPAIPAAMSGRKCRAHVIGVSRAIVAADAIRWTAPFWLDADQFALSVLLLASGTWGTGRKLIGAYGEVPNSILRGWDDLSWMETWLRGAALAIVLVDLHSEAREPIAAKVLAEARTRVPRVLTVALYPWLIVSGKLVPDPDAGVVSAERRVFAASESVVRVEDDGAPAERLALHADRVGSCLAFHDREQCWRDEASASVDRFASPVIRVLARASRAHFLPSLSRSPG